MLFLMLAAAPGGRTRVCAGTLVGMRPEPGQVLHFSEDPTITRFVPHVAATMSTLIKRGPPQ